MSPVTKTYSGRFALFFWLSFALVLLLNLLVWLYLNQVEQKFKEQLQDRLRDANQLLGRLMLEYNEDVNIHLLVPGDNGTLEYLFYKQIFEEIRNRGTLQTIILISPQGEILVSVPPILSEQTILSFTGSPNFIQALKGEAVVSDIEEYGGERFITGYMPITDLDGYLLAILIVEAKAKYFNVLGTLKNNILIFSLLNFILISLIAFMLFRMVRRTIRYEREIRDQQHLVQLGTMAASVAHELRNPLNIIEATNDTIRKKYEQNNDEIFEYIPQEVIRLNALIDDFLRFAGTPQLYVEEIILQRLFDRVLMGFEEADMDRIKVRLEKSTIQLTTDGNILQQIITNIITNSLQASDKSQPVLISVSAKQRNKIQIIIEDKGTGIPKDKLDKIFEPFYTTKERGTGLGLAISQRLIQYLQGTIKVESVPNAGTTVTLELPNLKQ
ncbi:MAG TPA: hypothetical protein EYP36_09130 [Calditrichaeota bacterium]|nr:hypothetical protein [Calditrichota bacterium]